MTCSDKSSSSSVESYGGDERRRVDALASIAQMQQQNMKAGINIDDQEHPSVMFRGMASDGPQENSRCSFCDKHFKGRRSCAEHELRCKNNPDAHSHTQIQSSGNAQGGIDVLNFHVPRKRRTARIPVLPEQPVKKPASDYAQGGINDNDAPRTPPRPTTSEVNADPSVIQRQNNDLSAIDTNSDKQKETISGGVDTNIPDHKDPSVMQMQSNLPPHNNSSDHKAPTCSFSSTDDLNAQVPVDANSDMEKKTHAIQIRRRTH
ncbi:uncharacterized protein LOC102717762 isoform X2 [Oryza brachyantha]|uniref:Uncharacterized protein n=2 Tax=Oryza brachyantha TaxID=4533 RepID=J3NEG9_ORYBR|nr:uncharacterized protein LOC102717762 isoform X2 [Oryza brachyantha]